MWWAKGRFQEPPEEEGPLEAAEQLPEVKDDVPQELAEACAEHPPFTSAVDGVVEDDQEDPELDAMWDSFFPAPPAPEPVAPEPVAAPLAPVQEVVEVPRRRAPEDVVSISRRERIRLLEREEQLLRDQEVVGEEPQELQELKVVEEATEVGSLESRVQPS